MTILRKRQFCEVGSQVCSSFCCLPGTTCLFDSTNSVYDCVDDTETNWNSVSSSTPDVVTVGVDGDVTSSVVEVFSTFDARPTETTIVQTTATMPTNAFNEPTDSFSTSYTSSSTIKSTFSLATETSSSGGSTSGLLNSNRKMAAIVGASVGFVLILGLSVIIATYWIRKNRKRDSHHVDNLLNYPLNTGGDMVNYSNPTHGSGTPGGGGQYGQMYAGDGDGGHFGQAYLGGAGGGYAPVNNGGGNSYHPPNNGGLELPGNGTGAFGTQGHNASYYGGYQDNPIQPDPNPNDYGWKPPAQLMDTSRPRR